MSRSRLSRVFVSLCAVAMLAFAPTAAQASPASSDSDQPVTIQACYDTAKSYTTDSYNTWPHAPAWAYTTSACNDINVRPNSGTYVRTCFQPSSGSFYCNAWRWIPGGTWGLAATDVKDGTQFFLEFDRYSSGRVAY